MHMLYPCIGNFGELVNSLLFRLDIQLSICNFCWRHQSCLEPFILFGNGMTMMGITDVGCLGGFSHIWSRWNVTFWGGLHWYGALCNYYICSSKLKHVLIISCHPRVWGMCDDVVSLRIIGCYECHTKISRARFIPSRQDRPCRLRLTKNHAKPPQCDGSDGNRWHAR